MVRTRLLHLSRGGVVATTERDATLSTIIPHCVACTVKKIRTQRKAVVPISLRRLSPEQSPSKNERYIPYRGESEWLVYDSHPPAGRDRQLLGLSQHEHKPFRPEVGLNAAADVVPGACSLPPPNTTPPNRGKYPEKMTVGAWCGDIAIGAVGCGVGGFGGGGRFAGHAIRAAGLLRRGGEASGLNACVPLSFFQGRGRHGGPKSLVGLVKFGGFGSNTTLHAVVGPTP